MSESSGPMSAATLVDDAVQETNFAAAGIPREHTQCLEALGLCQRDGVDADSQTSGSRETSNGAYGLMRSLRSDNVQDVIDSDRAAPKPSAAAKEEPPARAFAPDLLRGLLMVLMALDHDVMALMAWDHGQACESEMDSRPVHQWNRPIGYVIRTLTHLCAPGFTFLLGMGVVYFGRSRTRLGWSSSRLIRHFLIRAAVLTLICVFFGLAFTRGKIWFLNIILFSLGADYVLAGLLWLVFNKTEPGLTCIIFASYRTASEDDDFTRPLLARHGRDTKNVEAAQYRASAMSWHVHNALLLVLAGVTIWWNIWLSPTHGHCKINTVQPDTIPENAFFRIWFWFVIDDHVMSGFPPLAWLSFAILGLLYGRLTHVRILSSTKLSMGTLMAAFAFAVLFALTRILRFGNLSEDCLHMPEHLAHPDRNPYLASVPSFFYVIKYPPDVAFFAYTMSVNLLLLAAFGALPPKFAKRMTVLLAYGTCALFFYLVHQFLLFSIGGVLIHFFGRPMEMTDPLTGNPAVGLANLWAYFGTWAVTLLILYPLCLWYSRFKQKKGPDSIWRFF